MNSSTLSLRRWMGRAMVLSLLALGLWGCGHSTDSGTFQEYSDIEGDADPTIDPAAKKSAPTANGRTQAAEHAIPATEAEVAPAVAEASTKRTEAGDEAWRNFAGGPANATSPASPEKPASETAKAEPREIKLLIPDKSFRPIGPEEALLVSYDDIDLLKVLNMDPVPVDVADHLPGWLEQLDGKRIRIRGFMFPPYQDTNIPYFVLARDNQICCFGRDPKRYDVIDVVMRKGVTTDYIQNRPFDVVGIFRIQPEANKGQLVQLYVIEDATVIEL